MISKSEKMQIEGRKAVRKSLMDDGWKILFENTNTEDPVDLRAAKGDDKILVHIILDSNGNTTKPDLKKKLTHLKKKAEESNAYAFKATVDIGKDETLMESYFTQII